MNLKECVSELSKQYNTPCTSLFVKSTYNGVTEYWADFAEHQYVIVVMSRNNEVISAREENMERKLTLDFEDPLGVVISLACREIGVGTLRIRDVGDVFSEILKQNLLVINKVKIDRCDEDVKREVVAQMIDRTEEVRGEYARLFGDNISF